MHSEDEVLLQLDRELDIRLKNLREKRSSAPSSNKGRTPVSVNPVVDALSSLSAQKNPTSGNLSKVNNLHLAKEQTGDECNSENNYSGKNSKEEESTVDVDDTLKMGRLSTPTTTSDDVNESADSVEELDEAKDAIFDEFLDQSTQFRLKALTTKIATLTEALQITQLECKRLVDAKQEAGATARAAELSRRTLSKQLQSQQKELAKHQKTNKHLQERVKELTSECQALRKELSSTRQSECERKSAQSSSHAQLTRVRADNASLKEQIGHMKMKHKEELDCLQSTLAGRNERIKELERDHRNFSSLMKKQENLIKVLNEQKANIGIAKAAAGLEEKFLELIAPLQHS
ncbi:hypothetical protein SK128_020061 [Halocaridina rubra]|uniref:Testis-expressed sequence 9 protein n=1 Tax=Halocaridina rubra TaxID=373956 RepID=A0AAN8WTK4_HALRR